MYVILPTSLHFVLFLIVLNFYLNSGDSLFGSNNDGREPERGLFFIEFGTMVSGISTNCSLLINVVYILIKF